MTEPQIISFNEALNTLIEYYGYTPDQAEKYLFENKEEIFINESRLWQINYEYRPDYRSYLNSEKWKEIRRSVRAFYTCCQKCGSFENLQVHHLTYDKLGREEADHLILLCRDCHQKKHI